MGRREEWQGVRGGEKYKSGTGNWQIFSWNEPTGGKEVLPVFAQ